MSDGARPFRECIDRLANDLTKLVKLAIAEEVERLSRARRHTAAKRGAATRGTKRDGAGPSKYSRKGGARGTRERGVAERGAKGSKRSPRARPEANGPRPSRRSGKNRVGSPHATHSSVAPSGAEAQTADPGVSPTRDPKTEPLFVHRRNRDGVIVNLRRRAG